MGVITRRDAAGALVAALAGEVDAVENTSDTLTGNIMDGIMARFNGDPMSRDEQLYSDLVIGVGIAAGSSIYTRKRVENGQEPLLKFLF